MGSFTWCWQVCLWDVDSLSSFRIRQYCLFDVFDYSKGKNMYAAFDVTVIQKFSEVVKDLLEQRK